MKKTLLAALIMIFACLALFTACGKTPDEPQITYTDFIVTKENRAQIGFTDAENEHLVIPETFQGEDGTWYKVVAIGSAAFENCYNIVGVTVPDTVESIGAMAFYWCTRLETINLPDHTRIGIEAFTNTKYYLSNWDKDDTLYLNKHLIDVKKATGEFIIKDGTTVICGGALMENAITDIIIPDSVTVIGDSAFANTDITEINIPETVTYIGSAVFSNCTLLTSFTIPSNISVINGSMFSNCKNLTDIKIHDKVTAIGDSAFKSCTSLSSITIPDSVTEIGTYCFSDCTALTSITLPSKLDKLDNGVFFSCTALTDVTIQSNVTRIENLTFSKCTSLKKITIPDGVTYIGFETFSGCTELTEIEIPDSVKHIGTRAFIDTGAYNNESNWVNDVLYIDDYLILAKQTISGDYTVRQGTVGIANEAFSSCVGLTGITLPKSLKSVSSIAFSSCPKLTKLIVESDNPVLHSAGNCLIETQTKTLINTCQASVIPDDGSVTAIGEYAFYGNRSDSITLPSGITSIEKYAFYFANLTSITIPKTITNIQERAFIDCQNFANILYDGTVEEWNKIDQKVLLFIPSSRNFKITCTDGTIQNS